MPENHVPSEPSLPLTILKRIDEVCHRYEEAWQSGGSPILEDYLRNAPEAELPHLFRELLRLDLYYRRQFNRPCVLNVYLARFPKHIPIVRDEWNKIAPQSDLPETINVAPPTEVTAAGPTLSPAAATMFPDIPGYKIVKELGRGGMGVVYLARDLELPRLVALKRMLVGGEASEVQQQRVRTEAETVARLKRHDIVKINKIGEFQGMPYLALEFCEGGSLDKHLRGNPILYRNAARIVEKLAQAMEAAHQAQVVHRDLKPANVLLTKDGRVKISDFGLAKQMDVSGPTMSGDIMGTPSYMAPEQALGEIGHMDRRTDVYALGAILYELLTGRPPFKAATPMETLYQVVNDEPVPPADLQRGVPLDLNSICLMCLEKKPERRYQTARELATDLRCFLKYLQTQARPASKVEQLMKWCRRKPALASFIAVTSLALLTILLTSGYFIARLSVENNRANTAKQDAEKPKQGTEEALKKAERLRKEADDAKQSIDDKATSLADEVKKNKALISDLIVSKDEQRLLFE